jgi:thymidylate synthase
MPNTIGISYANIKMDLSDGFPLLTTKKMYWKGIVHELLWFLHGDTNIKYLVDNNVNIWNGDAYRWYLKFTETLPENDITYLTNGGNPFTMDEFIKEIKNRNTNDFSRHFTGYMIGDLGKVYGYQWRNQNGVDQIKEVLDGLKNNPYSRYHIIDGWNKADFKDMALPPCHLLYQFIVRPLSDVERKEIYNKDSHDIRTATVKKDVGTYIYPEYYTQTSEDDIPDSIGWYLNDADKIYLDEQGVPRFYLDLNMYQRSVDSACGLPFNLASMSILLILFAKANNMIAGVCNWIGGDTHIYVNHIDEVKEQIKREPFELPKMIINKEINSLEDILNLTVDDFTITDYKSHPVIKYELFTGLKK